MAGCYCARADDLHGVRAQTEGLQAGGQETSEINMMLPPPPVFFNAESGEGLDDLRPDRVVHSRNGRPESGREIFRNYAELDLETADDRADDIARYASPTGMDGSDDPRALDQYWNAIGCPHQQADSSFGGDQGVTAADAGGVP